MFQKTGHVKFTYQNPLFSLVQNTVVLVPYSQDWDRTSPINLDEEDYEDFRGVSVDSDERLTWRKKNDHFVITFWLYYAEVFLYEYRME